MVDFRDDVRLETVFETNDHPGLHMLLELLPETKRIALFCYDRALRTSYTVVGRPYHPVQPAPNTFYIQTADNRVQAIAEVDMHSALTFDVRR